MKLTDKLKQFWSKQMAKEATKNYTDEMVEHMTTLYVANPNRETVDVLAKEFGKSVRSVIAKLSREGVYIAQERKTKSGEPVVRKADLVSQLELTSSVNSLA